MTEQSRARRQRRPCNPRCGRSIMASQLGRARLSLPFIILAVLSLSASSQTPGQPRPQTGAEVLAATQFRDLAGLRVGLITNQTGQARGEPIARLLSQAPRVSLAAIF